MQRKLAFIHLMRTGGTFVNCLFQDLYSEEHVKDSWFKGLERDWSREEMLSFLERHDSPYVHNHVVSWDAELVAAYQRHGYFIFSFVRDVRDQLCSLYFWIYREDQVSAIPSLDEFINGQLDRQSHEDIDWNHWAIPKYWSTLDFVAEFSLDNITRLLRAVGIQGTDIESRWVCNGSCNPGFKACVNRGLVSRETVRRLSASVYQRRYRSAIRRPNVRWSECTSRRDIL